jgi:hypothetical protein
MPKVHGVGCPLQLLFYPGVGVRQSPKLNRRSENPVTIGMNSYANSFFAIATMAVGVPTGIEIFNWIGTMWGGRIQFKVPMLFCIGFLFQFLIAGLTGILQASF